MEPESSSAYSQAPATCPYPEPTLHVPNKISLFRFLLHDASPRNTPPSPEIRVGEYFTSGLFCLQSKHLAYEYFKTVYFSRGGVVSASPNPQAGGPPLVGCPRLLIQFFRSYPPYRKPLLHPQPEDAPCRGDGDPQTRTTTTNILI